MSISKYDTAQGSLYRVRYTTPAGKRTSKRGFKTKRSAQLWMAENIIDKSRGTWVDPSAGKALFNNVVTEFINIKGGRAQTTLSTRESHAANWVLPYWGGWQVGAIASPDVVAWVEWMRENKAKRDTIEKSYRVLAGALELAEQQKLIPRCPELPLELGKRSEKRRAYLTHAQVVELADAIDSRSRTLVFLLAYTGLRFGEAAALRRDSVDLVANRLFVRESVTEVHGELVWSQPKSRENRPVPVPSFLADYLRLLLNGRAPNDLLFVSARGGALRLTTWRRRVFYPAIASLNAHRTEPFPSVTPHDLRHTAASLAIQAGAHVKTLQRMLGHKSAALTLDTYADLFDSDLDDVAMKMDTAARAAGFHGQA